jgi:hypothetical protein
MPSKQMDIGSLARNIIAIIALVGLFVGWGITYKGLANEIEKNSEFRKQHKDLPIDLNNIERDVKEIKDDQKEAREERKEQLRLLRELTARPQR